jgi:hypothetical protein
MIKWGVIVSLGDQRACEHAVLLLLLGVAVFGTGGVYEFEPSLLDHQ